MKRRDLGARVWAQISALTPGLLREPGTVLSHSRPVSLTHIARRLGVRPQKAAGCPGQGSGGKGLSRDMEGLQETARGPGGRQTLKAGARALQPEWPPVLCCD